MTNRTLMVLAGALVLFSALALLGQREQAPAERAETLFLPGLQAGLDDVERVELLGAGGAPVATLQRGAEQWSVAERDGYPADAQKIRHTLLSLAEARILEATTANPQWHDRLGVEAIDNADAGGVAVALSGAAVPVSVIVGNTAGDAQAYVRRADEAQSYLIDRDPEVGSAVTDWLQTEIVAIPGDRMQQVTVTHPDGEILTITKADAEQANFTVAAIPEGRELQYEGVANVMGNVLANLTLQDVETRIQPDEPVTVTEFRTFDGLVITAESIERGEEAWAAFRAGYDRPAPSTAALAEAGDNASPETEPNVEAEARDLDERLNGWRYRIAAFQFDQLTRRMDDLLRPLPDES